MNKEIKQARENITSHIDKYDLDGRNKFLSCVNKFDKVVKNGVIIDDCGITKPCKFFNGERICRYENCPSYANHLAYLTLMTKQK